MPQGQQNPRLIEAPGGADEIVGRGVATDAFHDQFVRIAFRNVVLYGAIIVPGVTVLGTEDRGDPVKVKLTSPYKFWFMRSVGVTLTATATARLEQKPTLITNEVASC